MLKALICLSPLARWRVLIFCVALVTLRPDLFAQLVASHDLTAVSPKQHSATSSTQKMVVKDAPKADDQDCVIEFRDGVVISDKPERFSLKVLQVEPQVVYNGTKIPVVIRLTNEGKQGVLIPWETSPVEPVKTNPKAETTSYEQVSLVLRFGMPGERKRTPSIRLKGESSLYAAPNNRAHHVQLLPRQWVELRFSASLECDSNDSWACQEFRAGKLGELTAQWHQWLYTHEVEGCNVWRGAYESRSVESPPHQLMYAPTGASQSGR